MNNRALKVVGLSASGLALLFLAIRSTTTWPSRGGGDSARSSEPTGRSQALNPLESLEVRMDKGRAEIASSASESATFQSPKSRPIFDAIEACLRDKPDSKDILGCLRSAELDSVPSSEIGRWLCSAGFPVQKKALVLQAFLRQSPPSKAAALVDGVYEACTDYAETALLEGVITALRSVDPGWFTQLGMSVIPEDVFGARTDAPVEMLKVLAASGDSYALSVLTQGACGYFGGTRDQIHRAAAVAANVLPGGAPYMDLMEGVLDSVAIAGENDMGAFLVQFCLQGKAMVDGRNERAVAAVKRTLQDERYAAQAAMQLLKYFGEDPPISWEPSDWMETRTLAQCIATRR